MISGGLGPCVIIISITIIIIVIIIAIIISIIIISTIIIEGEVIGLGIYRVYSLLKVHWKVWVSSVVLST